MQEDKRNYHYKNSRSANSQNNQAPENNGAKRQNTYTQSRNGAKNPQSANNAVRASTHARRTPTGQSAVRSSVRNTVPAPQRQASRAAAPQKQSRFEGARTWFKKTFAVDKTVLEEHDIVREDGGIDYIFLVVVLILLALGTVMVYSASYAYSKNEYNDSYYIIFRQIIFVIIGFIGMMVAVRIPTGAYRRLAVPAYIFCIILLCLVPIIGVRHGGAKRWLSLGFTDIQPSEFMKLGLVLVLAWFFDRYYERVTDRTNIVRASFFGVFVPLLFIGVACLLVIIEPHLSGTIILFAIGLIMIFASGAPIRLLAALGGVGIGALGLVSLVTPYMKRRLNIWLHPEADPLGAGYQTLQGLYAIGSGGLFGEGLGDGYQKNLFVSQPQNDFIFTIVCEELGFIGAITVLLLFAIFAWRGFIIAMKAPDTFSSLVVIGIVGKVVLQALLNIAVVTNTVPNTGISLPFFSYGGSSLIVLMAEMGIVLSISRFSKQRKA